MVTEVDAEVSLARVPAPQRGGATVRSSAAATPRRVRHPSAWGSTARGSVGAGRMSDSATRRRSE
ncbi:MAG: hypothetical protein ACRD09_02550, partial [Vicinamibacterales bacterium]